MKRRVLAVGGPGPIAENASSVARAFAAAVRAGVEQHVMAPLPSQAGWSTEADAIVRAARAEDVVGVVIDRPAGTVDWALELAAAIDRPVVFSPRGTASPFELTRSHSSRRKLAGDSSGREAAMRFREVGADVVVLHCVHGASVPRFEDHPRYDPADWTREFTARYRDALGDARLEIRAGRTEDHAVNACDPLAPTSSCSAGIVVVLRAAHARCERSSSIRPSRDAPPDAHADLAYVMRYCVDGSIRRA